MANKLIIVGANRKFKSSSVYDLDNVATLKPTNTTNKPAAIAISTNNNQHQQHQLNNNNNNNHQCHRHKYKNHPHHHHHHHHQHYYKQNYLHQNSRNLLFNKQQHRKFVMWRPSSFAFIATISLAALLVVLVCMTKEANALNCYTCSSADNPACDESFTGRANITDTNCERQIGRPAKVCRKIVQYIEHKKVVIRSCGWIDEHEEKDRKPMCYKRSGTFALMMESCICYEDNCNHSASLVPNTSVLLTLIMCSMFLFFNLLRNNSNNNNAYN